MLWSPFSSEAARAEDEKVVALVGLGQISNCQEPLYSPL